MSRYIIDMDGVIANKDDWTYEDSYKRQYEMLFAINPFANIIKKINKLYKEGHQIIIHTSRIWHDYNVTVDWLKKHKVKYHTLIMAKPLGDVYVDDKNMLVEDFLNE